MLKILIPVDGSENSVRVIDFAIRLFGRSKEAEIRLITVRDPMDSLEVRRFTTAEQIETIQQESGNEALEVARARLDQAGVPYTAGILIGEIAETITKDASDRHCDMIVMGTRGMGTIGSLLMGSVATKVVHLADVPVALVK